MNVEGQAAIGPARPDFEERSHRWRAPGEDRGVLADPPLADMPALVAANRRLLAGQNSELACGSLSDLRREAREQLVAAALRYTSSYRPAEAAHLDAPIILAGHQPQMFHPGVWAKNFALAGVARAVGGTAINLVIDSDTIKDTSLRVPSGSVDAPRSEAIPFDEPSAVIPFEDRPIENRQIFAEFGHRACQAIAPLVPSPLIDEYWPLVQERATATNNLGQCLAQARHQLEGRWGVATLELPQSAVCDLPAFRRFTLHLFARLKQFREVHNTALANFRRKHNIRSANHPAADLTQRDGWDEAPLWMWTADAPRRRKVFVRRRSDTIYVSNLHGIEFTLPVVDQGDTAGAFEALAQAAQSGIRLRTRALVTTMFARVVLGDLFIHGIGGGKYDELTDWLIRDFFDLRPPELAVFSATMRLPIERRRVTADQARIAGERLREMDYHPERFLDAASDTGVRELLAAKQRWIATSKDDPQVAHERHQQIVSINAALQPAVEAARLRLRAEYAELQRARRAEVVLASREYAFCLYPEKILRDFLLAFASGRA